MPKVTAEFDCDNDEDAKVVWKMLEELIEDNPFIASYTIGFNLDFD